MPGNRTVDKVVIDNVLSPDLFVNCQFGLDLRSKFFKLFKLLMEKIIARIANELSLTTKQVNVVVDLLTEGATIPFIARLPKGADRQPG